MLLTLRYLLKGKPPASTWEEAATLKGVLETPGEYGDAPKMPEDYGR